MKYADILAFVIACLLIWYVLTGIKNLEEQERKIQEIGLKKYPICATVYSQRECIRGLEIAERQTND